MLRALLGASGAARVTPSEALGAWLGVHASNMSQDGPRGRPEYLSEFLASRSPMPTLTRIALPGSCRLPRGKTAMVPY
eukprot:3717542-Pyramimonas_sp.AAC.1